MEYVLLILLALAIPITGIVGFFMALGLRRRMQQIEERFAALDHWLLSAPWAQRPGPLPAAVAPRWAHPGAPAMPPSVFDAPSAEPAATISSEAGSASPAQAPPRATLDDAVAPSAGVVPPATDEPPPRSFEERFGTRWVVWIGGLALALGGIFLVRYSIEQGLIGPGVRIALGALLAAALVAAGEWTRRAENLSGVAGVTGAHIPSILTAAGTTVPMRRSTPPMRCTDSSPRRWPLGCWASSRSRR